MFWLKCQKYFPLKKYYRASLWTDSLSVLILEPLPTKIGIATALWLWSRLSYIEAVLFALLAVLIRYFRTLNFIWSICSREIAHSSISVSRPDDAIHAAAVLQNHLYQSFFLQFQESSITCETNFGRLTNVFFLTTFFKERRQDRCRLCFFMRTIKNYKSSPFLEHKLQLLSFTPLVL